MVGMEWRKGISTVWDGTGWVTITCSTFSFLLSRVFCMIPARLIGFFVLSCFFDYEGFVRFGTVWEVEMRCMHACARCFFSTCWSDSDLY
jgi:hypothetical protein